MDDYAEDLPDHYVLIVEGGKRRRTCVILLEAIWEPPPRSPAETGQQWYVYRELNLANPSLTARLTVAPLRPQWSHLWGVRDERGTGDS